MALRHAVLKPNERAICAILAVQSGMFKQISEACKHFGCKLNSYSYQFMGSAGSTPLKTFDLAAIKESVKAAEPAAAPATLATAAVPAAFNNLICGQVPISSVAALRLIKPHLKPDTGYMKKEFGFEDYITVMEWAGKEAADGPLGYRGVTLVVKVECGLQLHPNTVGEAKRRLLDAQALACKGACYPGAGTAAAAAVKAAPSQRRGGTAQYLHYGAVKLTVWVHGMCTHKLPIFKYTLMVVANAQIKGTK